MWCVNLVNYLVKTSIKADEALLQDAERTSAKALRILKRQGKTLTEVFHTAEHADSVEEVRSSFNLVNEVMMVFLADVRLRNNFGTITHCLKELGMTGRLAWFVERSSSLREALEEWKTEIASEVSKKQRIRGREQRLTYEFDEELIRGLFAKLTPETPSLEHKPMEQCLTNDFNEDLKSRLLSSPISGAPSMKRPRELTSSLVGMDKNLHAQERVEQVKSKKRRTQKDRVSRDERVNEEQHSSGRNFNKSSRVCFDYEQNKCFRGKNCRYQHIDID